MVHSSKRKSFFFSVPIVIGLIISGCAGAPSMKAAIPNYAVVQVYYATDRNQTGKIETAKFYGSDRGEITYGTCDVSIPRDHRMGELESPSILKLELVEDPEKHIVLLNIDQLGKTEYFQKVIDQIKTSNRKTALIFVHGYNVSFKEAARRTAQLSHDLEFNGIPLFYSWPSQGNVKGYRIDECNAKWSTPNFTKFLKEFSLISEVDDIFLIAHSMGNRLLTDALIDLYRDLPIVRTKIREVILAAPDIDAQVFKRDIVPKIADSSKPVTLYTSSEDRALLLSYRFNGYRRAGDCWDGPVLSKGLETIDATGVDTSLIHHSYYGDNRTILSDIFYLIGGLRPNDRFSLVPVPADPLQYWEFKK